MKFAENVDIETPGLSYYVSKFIHVCSLGCMLMLATLLQTSSGTGWPATIGFFSPIVVLITAISLFLFLADIVVTAQLNITWVYNGNTSGNPPLLWYAPLVRSVALGFLFLFFFNSVNSHRIRKHAEPPNGAAKPAMRPSLTDYFDHWARQRVRTGQDPIDVYLISGQGGGSRAAVWFYMAMNYLDSLKSTPAHRFADHVFSVSTVSGSTSGAAMYLADRYLDVPVTSATLTSRMKVIYARNYLSSSFWGTLIGDGVEGIEHTVRSWLGLSPTPFPKDRNYYFQREEVQGYADATPSTSKEQIGAFFNSDFLTPYARSFPSGKLPLFFINTAIVETGQRGVFAPVDLAGFSLATDLYAVFKAHHPSFLIPLITCVNQSQAFPVINAYNYLDGAGRLIDGGIYENSGTTATLEIYETLRRYTETHPDLPYRVRFTCINIVNTNMDTTEENREYRPASVLNTLTAAVQSPFGGHEQFSYRNILRRVHTPDTAFSFPLNKPVPLTRMLQSAAIDTMYAALRGVK